MKSAAIIVAAGRGTRAGGEIPKQYRAVGGQAVLARAVSAFADHPRIGQIVVVRHPDDADLFCDCLGDLADRLTVVEGGATRDASVLAGLAAVEAAETVLIHDGARPLVSADLIDRVLDALAEHRGAAPALPVTDALWRGAGGRVVAPHPRTGLYRAQTPQGFHLDAIRSAHAIHGAGAADDVEVALAHGVDVAIVEGEEDNIKITLPGDFDRAARILQERDGMDIRTGNGFDVHAFEAGEAVVLCGIKIPHSHRLKGHSDADVGMHALTDAIYGALALGDIGQHFPPSDPQWKGAASHIFLEHAMEQVRAAGFTLSHADVTLICERPRIGPHAQAMRAALSAIMGVAEERISVKATTSEKLGFTGREEGIAALATATLVKA
ncbi:bifunctional 2-C-methyl-D-erythritol 4-phosphate cytidylyltransferase/2-C-methyl-D-erythritol 2,4-cyclodiphosphate synthase [Actibacterium sp. MT2.3-13A]|uniref:bifunctional 2-C-methyl-D-erythritol 4-phosphate cytidylyltransferase/2-C-methyl-D-erythritol 2,4-cyclodiphosphate synthase n=1 Tax=Actibacterium sp. MT2.3-13A TaxID=2828332 RepID=UPI001BA4D2CD|nr:bifunctional 2-C-methyl-D-erythritol 4-phosphate cytidylyltransferase/2-C-methyl-D-erythritol 2,4-cyclodiphosphate synthase [Actibacterium sp. MT2.3-13A]